MSQAIREKLQSELDNLPWEELFQHFAYGRLLVVRKDLDLLDVAVAVAEDDTDQVKQWMADGLFGAPTDEEAKTWGDNMTQQFKVSIVSPYILVQEEIMH